MIRRRCFSSIHFQMQESTICHQQDAREAWGSWLQTVVRNCPKEKFHQFQAETLALAQRYQPINDGHRTNGQQCPAPVPTQWSVVSQDQSVVRALMRTQSSSDSDPD